MARPTNETERAESARRLLVLAEFLEKLPDTSFDYSQWVGRNECGTTACALGHACRMPEFNDLGLRLATDLSPSDWCFGDPACGEDFGAAAAQRPFMIHLYEAQFLFYPCEALFDESGRDLLGEGEQSPDEDASAAEVAKHIRRFVAKHRAPP